MVYKKVKRTTFGRFERLYVCVFCIREIDDDDVGKDDDDDDNAVCW